MTATPATPIKRLPVTIPSTDRTMPTSYSGDVEPNYYCRGRNAKRKKYCKRRAGHETDHLGIGRCKWHGGRNQNRAAMKAGGTRAKITHPAIVALIEKHEADTRPVKDKMLAALNHTLALRDQALADYTAKPTTELLDRIVGFNDVISKSGYRIEQIRAHGTIPIDRVKLFMLGIYSLLDGEVRDKALAKRLKLGIGQLRV